jgi:acyl dehydratase
METFDPEILAAARRLVGMTGPPVTQVIEYGAILRFVEAVGDDHPLYRDPEYARRTRWGGIIAPPTFLCTIRTESPQLKDVGVTFGTVNLNGGNTYEAYEPVRPGDVICAQTRVADVRGVAGRSGPMLIIERETRYINQYNRLVAVGRATSIRR